MRIAGCSLYTRKGPPSMSEMDGKLIGLKEEGHVNCSTLEYLRNPKPAKLDSKRVGLIVQVTDF